jgi:pyrimidine-specific ribonucleoside hydrolase
VAGAFQKMKLIVETDLGRDPDDFFALCYLIDAGVDLQLITISPGDPDQVAVAKFLLKECGLEHVPVGVSNTTRDRASVGSIHVELLKKYGYPSRVRSDGSGQNLMRDIWLHERTRSQPLSEFFGCGPLDCIGPICEQNAYIPDKATIQGGYISYETLATLGIDPPIKVDKFIGKEFVPTFNLNGNKKAGLSFLKSSIPEKRFVSKNVCHTIIYDKKVHDFVLSHKPKSRAGELLREGMDLYLQKNSEGKKFHDPSAAVCHLHPEIGLWEKGQLVYEKGMWGTKIQPPFNCKIIGAIIYQKLWEHIALGV